MEMFKRQTSLARQTTYTLPTGEKAYPAIVDIKKGIVGGNEISYVKTDNNVGYIVVSFVEGDEGFYIPPTAKVICHVYRPDGKYLTYDCTRLDDHTVQIALGISGTKVEGIHNFDLKIQYGNNIVMGTPIMSYAVQRGLEPDIQIGEDDRILVLIELIGEVKQLQESTEKLAERVYELTDGIDEIIEGAGSKLDAELEEFRGNADELMETTTELVENTTNKVEQIVTETESHITEMLQDANEQVQQLIDNAEVSLDNKIEEGTQSLEQTISDAHDRLDETIENANTMLEGAIQEATEKVDAIVDGVDEAVTELVDNVTDVVEQLDGYIEQFDTRLEQIDATVEDVNNALEQAGEAIENANQAIDRVTGVVDSIDENLVKVEGLVQTVEETLTTVEETNQHSEEINAKSEELIEEMRDVIDNGINTEEVINARDGESSLSARLARDLFDGEELKTDKINRGMQNMYQYFENKQVDLSPVEEKIEEHRVAIEQLNTDVADLTELVGEGVGGVSSKVDALEEAVNTNTETIVTISSKIDNLPSEVDAKDNAVKQEVNAKVDEKVAEVNAEVAGVKSAMQKIHYNTEPPKQNEGKDGDLWIVYQAPEPVVIDYDELDRKYGIYADIEQIRECGLALQKEIEVRENLRK